jgi:phosphoribosylformylglycinamidine (FGAM) synthase-like amidotransferase family enzyme
MNSPSEAAELVRYIDRIRERTMRVAACIPPHQIDWTPAPGKFSFGDLLRHLGAIERWMFAENAQQRPSSYPGPGR